MKNSQATLIRRGVMAVGQGLLELAIAREGQKGCSPVLCTAPVPIEPPYEPFDGITVLHPSTDSWPSFHVLPASSRSLSDSGFVVFRLFAGPEDLLTIGWMDSLLQALTVVGGCFAFELVGSGGRVSFRFAIPSNRTDAFLLSVQGLFPAVRVLVDEQPFPEGIPSAVEELVPVSPYHRTQTLLGRDGASPLGIAVAAIAGLPSAAFGLFQVLLQPAVPDHDWHYNVENLLEAERRASELSLLGGLSTNFSYDARLPALQEPSAKEKVRRDVAFFATIVRYSVWTDDPRHTARFLDGMRSATSTVRFGNRQFRHIEHDVFLQVLSSDVLRRMVVERVSHRCGVMVTSEEAATFVHLPNARTLEMFGAIEQRHGLEWRGPSLGPEEGTTLGINAFAGVERVVRIAHNTRLQHEYVVGATGSGKSNTLLSQALDDASNGEGVGVIDPHGDVALDILSRLPEERMRDLEYISFAHPRLVPRWNPFRTTVPSGKLADDLTRAFAATTSTFGPRMEHNFRLLTFVVHKLGGTLEDLAEIVGKTKRGEDLRVQALRDIATPEVQRFLRDELPHYRAADLDSVRNKLSRLLLDESLGAMFRQPENDLDPRRWMDEGRVVVVNLASGHIGTDHARFAGGLLVSLIHRAALTRSDLPVEERRRFFLYLDEFQILQTGTLAEILAEGRKYGLGAILAHQEGGQLSAELVQALGNCGTRVVFRPCPEDAGRVRRALLGRVPDADLLGLGRGEAFVASGDLVGSLRTALCAYPIRRDGRAAAAAYAAAHYHRVEDQALPGRRERTFDLFSKEVAS
jgi:Type IV secretion-system coupling protein DNA-binding domain